MRKEKFKPPYVGKLDDFGQEIPSDEKLTLPSGFKRPETLAEQVARLVRSHELARAAAESGHETFEEADDFEVDDDFDPSTPFEPWFDPVLRREVTAAELMDPAFREHAKKVTEAYMRLNYAQDEQAGAAAPPHEAGQPTPPAGPQGASGAP